MTDKIKKLFVYDHGRSYDLEKQTEFDRIAARSIWLNPSEPPLWGFQFHEVQRSRADWWFKHVNYPFLAIELVLSGGMQFQESTRSNCIHAGEILIIPPGTTIKISSEPGSVLHTLTLLISGSQLRTFSGGLGFLNGMIVHPRDLEEVEKKIRAAGFLLEQKKAECQNKNSVLCYEILLLLAEDIVREEPANEVQKVIYAFLANPGVPETAASLSKKAGCSESTLRKHFSLLFGRTPGAWICEQKMNYGAKLLRRKEFLIKEVADACGFENSQSFSHAFKRYFGTTPEGYRQEFKSVEFAENNGE